MIQEVFSEEMTLFTLDSSVVKIIARALSWLKAIRVVAHVSRFLKSSRRDSALTNLYKSISNPPVLSLLSPFLVCALFHVT